MAEYKVTGPDGSTYKVTGPDGATDEQVLQQVKSYKPAGAPQAVGGAGAQPAASAPSAPAPAQPPEQFSDAVKGSDPAVFVSGNLNIGMAGLMGLPVDTTANAMNLGAMGVHAIRDNFRTSANGPRVFNDPGAFKPPFQNPVGGSNWWESQMRRGGLVNESADPETGPSRYAAAALRQAPSAMIARPNMQQLPRALSATTSSAVAGEAGRDIGGDEWAGPASMLPGARQLAKPPTTGERATTERQGRDFGKAKELGIPVPPRALKADKPQQSIQDAINNDLRRPSGTEIGAETLEQYRAMHARDFAAVVNEPALNGKIRATPTFRKSILDLAVEERKLRAEFPNATKDVGLQEVLTDFIKPAYTTDGAMAQVRRLRESAKNNLSSASATDDTKRMGIVQRRLALALEDLIGENLQATGKTELYKSWTAARQKIAKSYDVESALDPRTGKINPGKLAALETEQPLSGSIKKIAEVSRAFPEATKGEKPDDALFTKRVSPMAVTHPTAAGAHWLTRLADPITTSAPYQHFRVDPRSHLTPEQQQMLRYLSAAQSSNRSEIPSPPR